MATLEVGLAVLLGLQVRRQGALNCRCHGGGMLVKTGVGGVFEALVLVGISRRVVSSRVGVEEWLEGSSSRRGGEGDRRQRRGDDGR